MTESKNHTVNPIPTGYRTPGHRCIRGSRGGRRRHPAHSRVGHLFSGDRHGVVMDPFGHRWAVCTKVEDVPVDEVARRAQELFFSDAAS